MPFKRDLKIGQKYEKLAREYFDDYEHVYYPKGAFKKYDFAVWSGDLKKPKEPGHKRPVMVEVKSDFLSCKTGNLAIEFECNGKPSGITASTADYWLIFAVIPRANDKNRKTVSPWYDLYKFTLKELRELVKDCRVVWGGDGGRSKMHLLPIRNIKKYKQLNKGIETPLGGLERPPSTSTKLARVFGCVGNPSGSLKPSDESSVDQVALDMMNMYI
jgi:hypothetical protein